MSMNRQQGKTKKLGISWTDYTLNPLNGCTRVSPGCLNCWASDAGAGNARKGQSKYEGLTKLDSRGHHAWTGKLAYDPAALAEASKQKTPALIFLNSMSDTFHESSDQGWIDQMFEAMSASPWHTWQVLTKRPKRMLEYVQSRQARGLPVLSNVLMGFSAENQEWWDKRWVHARQIAELGWKVWASIEPQIGPITLGAAVSDLDWIVIGGESTLRHEDSREFDLSWAEALIAECRGKVPVFMKQTGVAPVQTVEGKLYQVSVSGSGKHSNEWPESLRVQQFPQ